MFLKLSSSCSLDNIQTLVNRLNHYQVVFHHIRLKQQHYIVILKSPLSIQDLCDGCPPTWIEDVIEPKGRRFFTTKHFAHQSTILVKDALFGTSQFPVIAGPCSIESKEQIFEIAAIVKQHGAKGLRAGAFKPRTSPYDFQGLGVRGLDYLKQAAEKYGLFIVSELMDTEHIAVFQEHVDCIQIGARNMQNFALLKAIGQIKKPILLKRGLQATYEEFLSAAEYIMAHGNEQIILCERGIRTFEPYTRNTLDIAAIPILKDLSHLPVIVDPSHAVGIRQFVPALAYAALAAGADGLMVEVHTHPDESVSDAKQTIDPNHFAQMLTQLKKIAPTMQREV